SRSASEYCSCWAALPPREWCLHRDGSLPWILSPRTSPWPPSVAGSPVRNDHDRMLKILIFGDAVTTPVFLLFARHPRLDPCPGCAGRAGPKDGAGSELPAHARCLAIYSCRCAGLRLSPWHG